MKIISMHTKSSLKSLASKGMKMEITRSCHFTSTGMTVIKGSITSVDEATEKLELSDTAGGNVRWCGHSEKLSGTSSKPLSIAEMTY